MFCLCPAMATEWSWPITGTEWLLSDADVQWTSSCSVEYQGLAVSARGSPGCQAAVLFLTVTHLVTVGLCEVSLTHLRASFLVCKVKLEILWAMWLDVKGKIQVTA